MFPNQKVSGVGVLFLLTVLMIACASPTTSATFGITYSGNGATDGQVPIDPRRYSTGSSVTVQENSGALAKDNFDFRGWNSLPDASGTSYSPGSSLTMGTQDVVLYAVWVPSREVKVAGQYYPFVVLGNLVWTTVNYRGPGGQGYRQGQEKAEFGRYYTLAEARSIALPPGWRLPTQADFVALAEGQGVVFTNGAAHNQTALRSLVSTTGWLHVPGTNASGFNVFPAGYSFNGSDPIDGDIAEFWTNTGVSMSLQETALSSHRMVFYESTHGDYRFNLRFVRDR